MFEKEYNLNEAQNFIETQEHVLNEEKIKNEGVDLGQMTGHIKKYGESCNFVKKYSLQQRAVILMN